MIELAKSFRVIGARFKVRERNGPYARDVGSDRAGEYFELAGGRDRPVSQVLQAVPSERHLLLFAADGQRFLCGHDERHWFVAGIRDRISTVRAARESLLPDALREHAAAYDLLRRRNKAFVRQGEWLFVPAEIPPGVGRAVHRHERLLRDWRSKPHVCEFLVRRGGELVHFVGDRVYTDAEFAAARAEDPTIVAGRHRSQTRNPEMFARGFVRHPDHATIVLRGWHRVHLNGEYTTGSVTYYD